MTDIPALPDLTQPGCYDYSASSGKVERWACSLDKGHEGPHWAGGMRWAESGGRPEPDVQPAASPSRRHALAFNALTLGLSKADRFVPLSIRESLTAAILAAIDGTPEDAAAVPVPCPEGFHWVGQPFTHCDRCGLPAWEHAGTATMPRTESPFDDGGEWILKAWEMGEADACRRKWDPSYVSSGAES